MIAYRVLLGIDLLVAAVFGWYFLLGLSDGTVSADNLALWLAILGGLVWVIVGGIALWRRGATGFAIALLALLGVPAVLAGGVIAVLIISPPRWN